MRCGSLVNLVVTSVFLALACISCKQGDLRGTFEKSMDGFTYLVVADDNGGHCGPIWVDGRVWQHKIGEAARIQSGVHRIRCCGELAFRIPEGDVYKFSYWGP